jgi:regulator of extracellular matrix RemA (YlzA/DUF370 family)
MDSLLHVGFYNYVTSYSVVALIDYKIAAAKNIVRSARTDKPRSVLDVTKGRKALTLIVLTGDRYIISAIARKQLAKRLCPDVETEPVDETKVSIPTPKETFLNAQGESSRS